MLQTQYSSQNRVFNKLKGQWCQGSRGAEESIECTSIGNRHGASFIFFKSMAELNSKDCTNPAEPSSSISFLPSCILTPALPCLIHSTTASLPISNHPFHIPFTWPSLLTNSPWRTRPRILDLHTQSQISYTKSVISFRYFRAVRY